MHWMFIPRSTGAEFAIVNSPGKNRIISIGRILVDGRRTGVQFLTSRERYQSCKFFSIVELKPLELLSIAPNSGLIGVFQVRFYHLNSSRSTLGLSFPTSLMLTSCHATSVTGNARQV